MPMRWLSCATIFLLVSVITMPRFASSYSPLPPPNQNQNIIPGSKLNPADIYDPNTMSGPLGRQADDFFLQTFRKALATSLLQSESDFQPGYDGMIDMIRKIHSASPTQSSCVQKSRATLQSLFPDWPPSPKSTTGLLYWFKILFSTPFPSFSSKLNAYITCACSQWLMGPSSLLPLPSSSSSGSGSNNLVEIKRCRYLEATKCASICVNTCKLPTQQFFNEDMGVKMRIVPDYESYGCRFEFGVEPTEEDERLAKDVKCFAECPSGGEERRRLSCMN
ncbi:hypothetical protein TrVE_jg13380 [Triparma verrucosa]|uniref:Beta-carotene isomerase D27-like C-terminal domain-containing protein n=1 Tax=Triparma verrucosa TaxID=1606542 RepID=A0A9W7F8P9_9STRA|nr:hypothetical protein TrVE_jg13380 [Triparma verrucosa]